MRTGFSVSAAIAILDLIQRSGGQIEAAVEALRDLAELTPFEGDEIVFDKLDAKLNEWKIGDLRDPVAPKSWPAGLAKLWQAIDDAEVAP